MAEGKLIANRFELGDMIGKGGMGAVYRATDTRSGATVAVKTLSQDILASAGDEAVERFRREVDALRRLEHPNIIKLLGTAKENGLYYIVMEYAGGGSLADLLQKEGKLPVERALHIALDLADALTRAHRVSIIHRDIKPDNVLFTADGTLRLTDFGVARVGGRTQLTKSGYVVGTGAYLSPEACRGMTLDERADIWSFGVLLYEMLAGRRPFGGDSMASIVTAIMMEPLRDLRQYRGDVPEAVTGLVRRMLEKEHDKRIASARQVGARIETILSGAEPIADDADDYPAQLADALAQLADRWETLGQEAAARATSLRGASSDQAAFHQGVAATYQATAQDVRLTFFEPEAEDVMPTQQAYQLFVHVEKRVVEKLLAEARMQAANVYVDKGNVFSAIFPKLPFIPMEERLQRLSLTSASIIVLESGALPNTGQPYIDFGFTTSPGGK